MPKTHPPAKNPFGYRWLWAQTCLMAVSCWGRVGVVVADMARFEAWVPHIPLALYIGVWAVWGTLFAKLTWGMWRWRRWAIRWYWYLGAGYVMFALLWEWVWVRAPYARQRVPFVVGLTALILIVNLLLIQRRNMQQAFCSETCNDRY